MPQQIVDEPYKLQNIVYKPEHGGVCTGVAEPAIAVGRSLTANVRSSMQKLF